MYELSIFDIYLFFYINIYQLVYMASRGYFFKVIDELEL